jgi:outer membrane protein assembly factor BamA
LPADKRTELVPIEREGSVDQDILEDAARRISDYLQEQGYWKADIAPPERKEENGQLTIVFDVKRGPLFHVAPGGLQIIGTKAITVDELRTGARLAEVKLDAGEPFIASKMAAVEGAIRQFYRERGFATAQIESQPNQSGADLVEPVIAIKEGPRVLVGAVTVRGNGKVPAKDLADQIGVKTGAPYYGPNLAADRDRLESLYQNRGFQSAEVMVQAPSAPVSEGDNARADVVFQIREGVQTTIEHIFVTGNVRTTEGVIRRELRIAEGAPLGQGDLAESRRNLAALGLFRRIQISSVSHGDPSRSDVIVQVEESQRTTIDYGGGAQVEHILRENDVTGGPIEHWEFAPRGFFEIGRRNLGGKNRSANLYTRFGLRPSSDPDNPNPFGFSEYRVVGTYREPRALHNFGELTATAAIEQSVRTGFNFIRKGGNAELTHRVSQTVRVSGQYAFTKTRIFDEVLTEEEQLTVDRVFSRVRLSMVSGALSRDTRDDLVAPQHGTLLSADTTLAARAFGSEVDFIKLFMQSFYYRNLGRRNVVFAGGARIGLARAGEQIKDDPAGAGPAGQRAVLRRRRHDHPGLRARRGRDARDADRRRLSEGRQRGSHPQTPSCASRWLAISARWRSSTAATSSPACRISISRSSAPASGSARATVRRSGRFVWTSASLSTGASPAATSRSRTSCTSPSDTRSDDDPACRAAHPVRAVRRGRDRPHHGGGGHAADHAVGSRGGDTARTGARAGRHDGQARLRPRAADQSRAHAGRSRLASSRPSRIRSRSRPGSIACRRGSDRRARSTRRSPTPAPRAISWAASSATTCGYRPTSTSGSARSSIRSSARSRSPRGSGNCVGARRSPCCTVLHHRNSDPVDCGRQFARVPAGHRHPSAAGRRRTAASRR